MTKLPRPAGSIEVRRRWWSVLLVEVLCLPLRLYQVTLSPLLPRACRFHPSCSRYMVGALRTHGAWRGLGMGLLRIARCHPFHPGGVDPVPPARSR